MQTENTYVNESKSDMSSLGVFGRVRCIAGVGMGLLKDTAFLRASPACPVSGLWDVIVSG